MRTYEKPVKQPAVARPTQLAGEHRTVRPSTQTGPRAEAIYAARRHAEKRAAQDRASPAKTDPASAAKTSDAPELVGYSLPEVEVTAQFPLSDQEIIDEIHSKIAAVEQRMNSEIQARWGLDRPGPRYVPIRMSPYKVTDATAFEVGGNVDVDAGVGVGLHGGLGPFNASLDLDLATAKLASFKGSWNALAGPKGEWDAVGKEGGVTIATGAKISAGALGRNFVKAGLGQSFRAKDGSYSEHETYAFVTPEGSLRAGKHDPQPSVRGIRPDKFGKVEVDKKASAVVDSDPQKYQKEGSTDFIRGGDFYGLDFGIGAKFFGGVDLGGRIGFRDMQIYKTLPREKLIKQLLAIRTWHKSMFERPADRPQNPRDWLQPSYSLRRSY